MAWVQCCCNGETSVACQYGIVIIVGLHNSEQIENTRPVNKNEVLNYKAEKKDGTMRQQGETESQEAWKGIMFENANEKK